MRAIVTKSTGSWFTLQAENGKESFSARLRGSLRLSGATSTAPVVVGDWVVALQNSVGEWIIDSVEQRKNYLVRKSTNLSRQKHIIASNIDTLYVVASLREPETSFEFIDRVLVAAQAYSVEAKIVINKCDIAMPSEEFLVIYRKAGYEVFIVSATTGEGVSELRDEVRGKVVLFSGNSGVGKSSLINAIDPNLELKTGEISSYHKKGKHTTTFSEIFNFGESGYLIDTPGIKGFGLVDIEKEELWHYFPEIMRYAPDCSFYNCTHTHEPKCAVRKAVENDDIAPERYFSYIKMIEEDEQKNNKYR
ncbi:MAG: ribosome small subunit-dependent GTPase A [Rikenellaceae bacterium]